jgi:hypothetical protein
MIAGRVKMIKMLSALCGLLVGCAAPLPSEKPAELYQGPIAERPSFQRGDYWVYEQGDRSRITINLLAQNIGFPLWVGRTWSYDAEALPRGRNDPKGRAPRTPVRIDCQATKFQEVAVRAGTFGSFQCECECKTTSVAYEPDCGEWRVWYAPDVKNIIKASIQAPTGALELIEYRVSRQPTRPAGRQARARGLSQN